MHDGLWPVPTSLPSLMPSFVSSSFPHGAMSSGGGNSTSSSPLGDTQDDVTRITPVKRRRLLPLVDLRGPGGMTSSSIELGGPSAHHHLPVGLSASASLGHGRRSRTPLTDLDSKFVTKSGFCGSVDLGESGGSFRGVSGGSKITHFASSSGVGGATSCDDSVPRFPRLDQCAHFHYEYVELPPIQVILVSEELKPLSSAASSEDGENRSLLVQVTSLGRSWVVRRTYDNFRFLDRQLHRCCYDRKFSQLPELPPEENLSGEEKETAIETALRAYLSRLSDVAGSLITCGPVLGWLELDNRGHRLIVTDDSDINTPAVAAAYVVKRYAAQASDEISFEVGDMISVIDMPPPEESIWWRGKRGFQVGFFPCECVQVIGDKIPQAIHPQVLTLPHTRSSINTPPTHPHQTHTSIQSASSGSGSTVEPMKPVLRKHGKLIAFFRSEMVEEGFRSFILSRPSRRKLKQSGILRERVFGCDLGEHLLNSGHEIPMVLKCCSEFIESHGTVDGIYRLSGITSNIQKLRNAFDEERVPDLYGDESILQDIHCVSSVLKMYFRELPNPLLTYQLYDKFVHAVMQNEDVRLLHVRDVVQQLPPPHYRTLEYLVQHLARIASHSSNTGMTPRNIAIVWAPNLLRSKDLEKGGVAALQDVGTQAVVTEYLVRYVDLIFNDKIPTFTPSSNGFEGTPKKSRPKSLAISTPTKLLSIDEARNRAFASIKSDQKYIEVGGGPQSLPKTYHTVIDLPSRKGGSLKQKKSPLGWKTLFSKNRHQRKASTPNEISLNVSDPAVTESDMKIHSIKRLRPVKSVESLVSTPASMHSGRNLQTVDNEFNSAESRGVKSPRDSRKERASSSSSDSGSLPSPRTHNRSVSHDSYFNLLEHNAINISAAGAVTEERESDLEFSPESSKIFLDISELNIDFNMSEAEMKIFSEDDTLKSTSVEDTLSRSTIDLENVSMNSDCSKSKENVNSSNRDSKKNLKESLKQKFSSPSTQRREARLSKSVDETRNNSLKRASAVIKDKFVQALSPESLRRKVDSARQSSSPSGSPKYKVKKICKSEESKTSSHRTSDLSPKDSYNEISNLSLELSNETRDFKSRESFDSALIDADLLDKITHMRVSSSISVSEASSISLAEATVSDNESFTIGSSSSGAAAAAIDSAAMEGCGGSDSGSTVPYSSRTTPCTPPVTIVTDPQFQEEIIMRERSFHNTYEEPSREDIPNAGKPKKDRPNSLLGIPSSDLSTLGGSLTSPDTPQGDSTFLEIQYHPLSDTTEPSTPSESHVEGEVTPNLVSVEAPRKSSPYSPDLSSSSGDDPIENGPVYENVELTSSLPLTKFCANIDDSSNKDSTSSSLRQSPDADTPIVEEQEMKYENVEYSHLNPGDGEHYSDSVTPCYENFLSDFSVGQTYENICSNNELEKSEENSTYANVNLDNSQDLLYQSEDAYEEVSFSDHPEYENVEFSKDNEKSEAEIEGEMVYQQVKYLRRSIQEVNEILSENLDDRLLNESILGISSVRHPSEEESDSLLEFHPPSEESECLESPVTPSSSSLVTEVMVLPSFSSPTESITEEATSDASDHISPKPLHQPYSPSPTSDSPPPTVVQSPNTVPYLLPSLSPSSPDRSSRDNSEATSPDRAVGCAFIPSPLPRLGPKHSQVWPPVPKPRSLPTLNLNSPSSSNPSVSPDSPATSGTLSGDSTEGSLTEDQEALLPSSQSNNNESETSDSPSSLPVIITQQLINLDQIPESESQKRERIEKYKEERRSFLREKYKSESFKGEKDEMILRLKQKATSPSRLEENDCAICDPNSKSSRWLDDKKLVDIESTGTDSAYKSSLRCDSMSFEETRQVDSSPSFHCSSISNIQKESMVKTSHEPKNKTEPPIFHRSISEDSKIASDIGMTDNSQVSSASVASLKTKNSPVRTSSDSTFQKSSAKFRPDEDINVRERVAIWSRQKESEIPNTCKNVNGAPLKSQENLANKDTEPLQAKLRKVQVVPLRGSDSNIVNSSHAQKIVIATKDPISIIGKNDPFVSKVHKLSTSMGNRTNKFSELPSPTKAEFPPSSTPFTKSAPHSPIKMCPILVSQKSESDLRNPRPLKTVRSYSVSTALGSASKNRSTNQQTRIKDMKALFEKESPTSDYHKPFPIRQTSKGGV